MNAFQIWFYNGSIALLIGIIGYLVKKIVGYQEEKNKNLQDKNREFEAKQEKFLELLKKNEEAINKLNMILDMNKQMCNERHQAIEKKFDSLEKGN